MYIYINKILLAKQLKRIISHLFGNTILNLEVKNERK